MQKKKNVDFERREREERRKWRKRGSILRRQRLASPTAFMVVAPTTQPVQKRIGFMASFKATVRTDTVDGGWEEGERRERNERERAARTNRHWRRERQLKSAKREVISRAEEECWRWKKRKRREKEVEKAGRGVSSNAGSSWLLSHARFFPFFLPLPNPRRPCQSEPLP